jgi:hypothetical protein
MATLQCERCDKPLQGRQSKFCSKNCCDKFFDLKRAKQRRKPLTCGYCGIDITSKKHTRKFCSRRCAERNLYESKRAGLNLIQYGLSEEEHLKMLIQQDHRCAICRKPETSKDQSGNVRKLAIDHCHEIGITRGLLCSKCNLALGLFQDSWLVLDNAQEYLVYWHSKLKSSHQNEVRETPSLH